jgi:hypothetical protein
VKRLILLALLIAGPALAQNSHGDKRAITFSTVPSVTVGGLGACGAGNNGAIFKISDALTPVVAAVAVGGGVVAVLVHCQSGTGWIVG